MKIVVIGASGSVGSRIVSEALSRGHQVTAIARRPERIDHRENLQVHAGDIGNPSALSKLLIGHDVVVSAVRFVDYESDCLFEALKAAGLPRLVMVGGAGSLMTAAGSELVDAPSFPQAAKAEARAGGEKLKALRAQTEIDWTFLSPSAVFMPGERTGQYRIGTEQLLVDAEGRSRISQEDYAIALLDEIEEPRHHGERFTVGY